MQVFPSPFSVSQSEKYLFVNYLEIYNTSEAILKESHNGPKTLT
jgi:hypothetical protein